MPNNEERIVSFLLAFVDFLYAVLFGFVLQQLHEKVLIAEGMSYYDKATRVLLVIGVFYFLMGDWISARLLTARNVYTGYRRFFLEVIIAFSGFGAAIEVLRAHPFFLGYIILVLVVGAYWAHCTIVEYPKSSDLLELNAIRVVQPITAIAGGISSYLWYKYVGELFSLRGAGMLFLLGWLYEFFYELSAPSLYGLAGGPTVPFVSKERMIAMRQFLGIKEREERS